MQADTSPVHDASMFTVVPWQPRHTLHGLEVTKQQDWHAPVSAQQPSLPGALPSLHMLASCRRPVTASSNVSGAAAMARGAAMASKVMMAKISML